MQTNAQPRTQTIGQVEGWQPSPGEGTEVELDLIDIPFRFDVTAATPHKPDFDEDLSVGAGFHYEQQQHLYQPSPAPVFSRRPTSSFFSTDKTPTQGVFLTPPTSRHASPASTCSVSSNTSTTTNSSSTPLSSTERRAIRQRARDPNYIPRPPNPFILFRIKFVEQNRGINAATATNQDDPSANKSLSALAGEKWKELSEAEKDEWKKRAEEVRKEHERMHPGYRYRPTRKSRDGGRGGSLMRDLSAGPGGRMTPSDRMAAFTEAQRAHRRTSSMGTADDISASGMGRPPYQPRRSCPGFSKDSEQEFDMEEQEGLFMLSHGRDTRSRTRQFTNMLLPPAVINTASPRRSSSVSSSRSVDSFDEYNYSDMAVPRSISPATANGPSDLFKDLDDSNVVSLTSKRAAYQASPWQNQANASTDSLSLPQAQSYPGTYAQNGVYYTQIAVPPQPISIDIPTQAQLQQFYQSQQPPSSSSSSQQHLSPNMNFLSTLSTPISAGASAGGPVSSLSELTPEHMRELTGFSGLSLAGASPSSPLSNPNNVLTPASAKAANEQFLSNAMANTANFGMGLGLGLGLGLDVDSMQFSGSDQNGMFFNFEDIMGMSVDQSCSSSTTATSTSEMKPTGGLDLNLNEDVLGLGLSGQCAAMPIDFENCGFDDQLFGSFDFAPFQEDVLKAYRDGQQTHSHSYTSLSHNQSKIVENKLLNNNNANDYGNGNGNGNVEEEENVTGSSETLVPSSCSSNSSGASTVTGRNTISFPLMGMAKPACGNSQNLTQGQAEDILVDSDMDVAMIKFFDSIHQE